MDTLYGVVKQIKDDKLRADCETVYWLLNDEDGMKVCRGLLRDLSATLGLGKSTLSDELVSAENAMGFSGYVLIKGDYAIPGAKFLMLIAKRIGIIDQAAGFAHGWHTHRLQWWLVYTAFAKGKIKLHQQPGELYSNIGQDKTALTVYDKPKYIWDDLFDQQGYPKRPSGKQKAGFGWPEEFAGDWMKRKKKDGSKKHDDAYAQLVDAFNSLEGNTGGITKYEVIG